jgi:hypothetical protein
MNKANKFWVLSEVYYPEEAATAYIITEIVDSIADFRDVNVICGPVSYEKKSNKASQKTFKEGIKIQRINSIKLDKNKIIFRAIKMVLIAISMSFRLLLKSRNGDEVLIVTNPAFLLLLTGYVVKLRNLKLYILVHDVFPENVVAAGILKPKSRSLRVLKNLFDKAYSKADVLIVLGRDMELVIKSKILRFETNNRVELIENWADVNNVSQVDKSANAIIQENELSDKIVFQYAGNLGRVQGLQNLFSIINEVNNPLLYFLIIGEGAIKKELEKYIFEHSINNIKFLPSMPRSAQNDFLNACDVSIVCLTENMLGLGVPSKSYNIMAAGKPILFIGDKESEIALTIKENDNGWVFGNSERDELIHYLNNISRDFLIEIKTKGDQSRFLAETKYSKKEILYKFQRLFRIN